MKKLNDAGTLHSDASWRRKLANAGQPDSLAPLTWRQLAAWCLCGIGVLGFPVILAFPYLVAMMDDSRERFAIVQTGLPTDPQSLEWTEWKPAADEVACSEIAATRVRREWPIVEYRIGTRGDTFTALSFYQAHYRMENGKTRDAHADGPTPLIRVPAGIASSFLTLAVLFATLMLALARWITRSDSATTAIEETSLA